MGCVPRMESSAEHDRQRPSEPAAVVTAVGYTPKDLFSTIVGCVLRFTLRKRRLSVRRHLNVLRDRMLVDDIARSEKIVFRFHALYYRQLILKRYTHMVNTPLVPMVPRRGGLLLLTVHKGPWDSAARWLVSHSGQSEIYVVAKPQRFAVVSRWVERRRLAVAVREVWHSDRNEVARICQELLQDGRVVVIFADRDYWNGEPNSILFGRTTSLPLELLSQILHKSVPTVLAGSARFVGKGKCEGLTWVLPKIMVDSHGDLRDPTILTRSLEQMIETDPLQWHMFSKRW
jgi:lauroyl/myristoyl acyltransferase